MNHDAVVLLVVQLLTGLAAESRTRPKLERQLESDSRHRN